MQSQDRLGKLVCGVSFPSFDTTGRPVVALFPHTATPTGIIELIRPKCGFFLNLLPGELSCMIECCVQRSPEACDKLGGFL